MDSILTGFGILLLIVGLVTGYASGMGLEHHAAIIAPTQNWFIEAVVAIAFMVAGGLILFFGIKKS
jgi:hypothetical protein